MFKYHKTEAAKAHNLSLTMALALLGIGTVRPVTIAALFRRGLADQVSRAGIRLTEEGKRVAEAMRIEVYGEEDRGPVEEEPAEEEITTADLSPVLYGTHQECMPTAGHGTAYPECEEAGGHTEADHEPGDCGWPPLYNGPVPDTTDADIVEPQTTIAREIVAGDVIVWAGDRWPVLGVRSTSETITVRIEGRTLTMDPTTPVRRAAEAQTALAV